MKKVFLVVAMAALLSAPAMAASFDFSFVNFGGTLTETGTVFGNLVGPGQYLLTSGTIFVTGGPAGLNGGGILVSPPPQPFQVGGGTQLIGLDDILLPGGNPMLTTTGGLAFQMSSGLGLGIGGNGRNDYWTFGGNWILNDNGNFSATQTPEPGSLILLLGGLGLLAFGAVRRKSRKPQE